MSFAVLLLLSLRSLAAEKAVSVASPGLHGVDITADRAVLFTGIVGQAMSSEYVAVMTPQDLAAVLGFERQKLLMGCAETSTTCMAEIAAAFGADALLRGDLAHLGTVFHANLKLISPHDGHSLAAQEVTAPDEVAFVAALKVAGRDLAIALLTALRRTESLSGLAMHERNERLATMGWVPTIAGASALVAGGVLLGLSSVSYQRLKTESALDDGEAARLASGGSTMQTAGVISLAAGGAVFAAGVVMLVLGHSSPVEVAIAPSAGGGTLVVGGSF